MHPLVLAALLCGQPDESVVVVKFDTIMLRDAERLDGKAVAATFTVAAPVYTWGEGRSLRTIVGPAARGGYERTAVLRGDRLHDADKGARVTVVGTLRVIRHPAATVRTMDLGAWIEIRIEER